MRVASIALAALGFALLPSVSLAQCPAGTYQSGEQRRQDGNTIVVQAVCDHVPTSTPPQWVREVIASMFAHARAAGWSQDELTRLWASLNTLPLPPGPNSSVVARMTTWDAVRARAGDAALIAAASTGRGASLFSSGWQSGQYEDCTLFALATATGRPYGVVAASAGELIRSAAWRPDRARADPRRVFHDGGLVGGEVIILAEQYGRAQILPPQAFAGALEAGWPVMVSVSLPNAERHQVVLSRIFQNGGVTWYEMIDSAQRGAGQRTFISHAELNVILDENGITYLPDPERTAPLLR